MSIRELTYKQLEDKYYDYFDQVILFQDDTNNIKSSQLINMTLLYQGEIKRRDKNHPDIDDKVKFLNNKLMKIITICCEKLSIKLKKYEFNEIQDLINSYILENNKLDRFIETFNYCGSRNTLKKVNTLILISNFGEKYLDSINDSIKVINNYPFENRNIIIDVLIFNST